MVEGKLVLIPGLSASADLSAKQYRYVKVSGDGTVDVCSSATDISCGILQNKPTSGQAASVAGPGSTSKVDSDGALTAGNMVGTSADGQADVKIPGTDTTEYMCGQVIIGSTAAGEKAYVTFDAPRKAT